MKISQVKKKASAKEIERQALVKALAGKYASSKNSSEEFSERKEEEIELEKHVRRNRTK